MKTLKITLTNQEAKALLNFVNENNGTDFGPIELEKAFQKIFSILENTG